MSLQSFMASCRDRLARSRFFTVSLTLHLILIGIIGRQIITRYEPPEVIPTANIAQTEPIKAPEPNNPVVTPADQFNPTSNPQQSTQGTLTDLIAPRPTEIFHPITTASQTVETTVDKSGYQPPANIPPTDLNGPTKGELKVIGDFTKWRKPGGNDRFVFTAFIGKYQGGNWSSTVRLKDGQVAAGSLPNLLYAMSKWSKDRIQTNERNVKAIALDSDELLTARPPFVFLTGTKDFKLTGREVENLRNYIRSGGAVWGDSSVPGRRSAFDIAFKREMQRVMGENSSFEPLAANHPVFTEGYFSRVKQLPRASTTTRSRCRCCAGAARSR